MRKNTNTIEGESFSFCLLFTHSLLSLFLSIFIRFYLVRTLGKQRCIFNVITGLLYLKEGNEQNIPFGFGILSSAYKNILFTKFHCLRRGKKVSILIVLFTIFYNLYIKVILEFDNKYLLIFLKINSILQIVLYNCPPEYGLIFMDIVKTKKIILYYFIFILNFRSMFQANSSVKNLTIKIHIKVYLYKESE